MTTPETAGEPTLLNIEARFNDAIGHAMAKNSREHETAWNDAMNMVRRLTARVREAEAELERSRMQLVACSMAATGNFTGCADEYKSVALSDVLGLRAQLTAATERAEKAEATAAGVVNVLGFFASCIKCGEPWTPECEAMMRKAFPVRAALPAASGVESVDDALRNFAHELAGKQQPMDAECRDVLYNNLGELVPDESLAASGDTTTTEG